MQFCQNIAFPSSCYVPEVAFWLAFGRVPDVMYDDEWDESRNGRHAQETGEIFDFDYCFSVEEFRLIGCDIDPDRYVMAKNRTFGRSRSDIENGLNRILEALNKEDCYFEHKEFIDSKIKEARTEAERAMEDADWLADVEAPFAPHVDTMKAVVFQALAQGRLKASGWLEFTPDEIEANAGNYTGAYPPEPPAGRFVNIPKTAWTLMGFDWGNSTLTSGRLVYRAVQCRWVDVMSLFPTPQCEFSTKAYRVFPGVAIMDGEEIFRISDTTPQRRRGRPAKQSEGIDIRRAAQNYFRPKIRCMDRNAKREAVIAEVMDFVKIVFDTDISRSTAQAYISSLWDEFPLTAPEVAAEE